MRAHRIAEHRMAEKNQNNCKQNSRAEVKQGMNAKQRKYDLLVDSHANDLFRYACWVTKDKNMAEDVLQETYMRAWKSLDNLRDPKAAKSWLFTIFRREYARQFERKRFDMRHVEDLDNAAVSKKQLDDSPEAFVLRRALEKLDEDYREPLLMQVLGGYSCDEIADTLGLSSSAVMTRLFRARKKMRDLLGTDKLDAIGVR